MTLINLDQAVLNALKFFISTPAPKLKLPAFKMPLVIGSGNAYTTGAILFSQTPAIMASETNLKMIVKKYSPWIENKTIDGAIVISASGGKDSVWEIALAKKMGLKTHLLTCNAESMGAKTADSFTLYRRLSEPYTFNVSTYLGMILSQTKENPHKILDFIQKLKAPKNIGKYQAYSFVIADQFEEVLTAINIKTREMFGSFISFVSYTAGAARHARYVSRNPKELVISLGVDNKYFGDPKGRWNIKLPSGSDAALIFCLSYYIIGLIQKQKPPYFKKNISRFCSDYGPKAFGKKEKFDLIVPGN